MTKTIYPIIKWTGGKRYIAKEIVSRFPKNIDTYYEPFIGGGSVLAQLLESDVKCKHYIASDINKDLISLWIQIKDNPQFLLDYYKERWNKLNSFTSESDKRDYFISQRELYNVERKPEQFLFLSRTCYLGMVRYNKKGNSNVAFGLNRPGISPAKLEKLLIYWSNLIKPVEFRCCDYKSINPNNGDYLFADAPYFNVTSPVYFGKLSFTEFVEWLSGLKCRYSATLDGKNDNEDKTCSLPDNLGLQHEYIKMGNSSLRRMVGDKNNIVFESFYSK